MAGCDIGKWQFVRLIDIFFLGPFMMLLADEMRPQIEAWKSDTLYFFGFTTILVNAYFFIKISTT